MPRSKYLAFKKVSRVILSATTKCNSCSDYRANDNKTCDGVAYEYHTPLR